MRLTRRLRALWNEIRYGLASTRVDGEVVMPLLDYDHGPVVAISLDGEAELPFLVDTGAECSCLLATHPAARNRRPLRRHHTRVFTGARERRSAVAGYVPVRSLRLGEAEASHLDLLVVGEAVTSEYSKAGAVPGILGQDVLRNWGVLFDPERREIRILHAGRGLPADLRRHAAPDDAWHEYEVDFASRIPAIALRVQGRGPYPFIVDSGNEGTSVSGVIASELGLQPSGSSEQWTIGGTTLSPTHELPALGFGGVEITATGVDLHTQDLGLLGWAILRRFAIVLDGPGCRLFAAYREGSDPQRPPPGTPFVGGEA